MKTLIIGLGNPILTDDGVGLQVAKAVRDNLEQQCGDDLQIIEASVGGLRLMEMMVGFDRVILIDAYKKNANQRPGRIHRMSLDDLRTMSPTQHTASDHDTNLATAMDAGYDMKLHLPTEIIIFAIEVENVTGFGECPTPAVAAAIPETATAVIQEIDQL